MSIGKRLAKVKKVDNHKKSEPDKIELRRLALREIGEDRAAVLDCFAGSGRMHKAVWKDASSYVGCDTRFFFDRRTTFVCDNIVMLRSIDLSRFNLFDLDAYGCPWHQAIVIGRRRPVAPGEKIGIVLTEGSGLKMKFGATSLALAELSGFASEAAGLYRARPDILNSAVVNLAKMMRCNIVKRWQAERKQGSAMVYMSLILEGAG